MFGPKGSGKDTVCEMVKKSYERRGVPTLHVSFAGPLKDLVEQTCGNYMVNPHEQVWGSIEKKEFPIDSLPITDEAKEKHEFLKGHDHWSGRLLLQFMGTEVFRTISPTHWINLCTSKIIESEGHVLVSDCRFANEMSALEHFPESGPGWDLVNIRIRRMGCEGDGHASEDAQKAFKPDHIIDNDAPLDVLEKVVNRILDEIHE